MWFYVQIAFPLLTVGLAAAICFSVTVLMRARPTKGPQRVRIEPTLEHDVNSLVRNTSRAKAGY
jgi:hypothetical protein